MISSFQEDRRRPANGLSTLFNSGGLYRPTARATGGITAQGARPRTPAHTGRPGPQPTTARQAAAVAAQNARIKQEVEATAAECKRAIEESDRQAVQQAQRLPFSRYDFDKRRDGVEMTDAYGNPLGRTRFQVGSLWVFATSLSNRWQDRRYFIYNPQTHRLLEFVPEASIDPRKRLYASKQAQIQGTAAATGRVGRHLQWLYGGTAAGFFGGAVALEAGAYYWVAEEAAPFVGRVAVRAYQVAAPAVRTYAQRAAKGALMRMGVDASFQFGTGYVAANPDPAKGSRVRQALGGINGTSIIAAGLIDAGGLKAKAKFLLALGSAATTNLVTLSKENSDRYGSALHMVDFHDTGQSIEYVRNVILGTLFDQGKEYGSEWVTGRVVGRAEEWAARTSGRLQKAALQWITESRVALPSSFVIGGVPEVLKKKWEQRQAEAEEQAKRATQTQRHVPSRPHRP